MSAHDRKAHTKKVWLDNSTSGEKKKKKLIAKPVCPGPRVAKGMRD